MILLSGLMTFLAWRGRGGDDDKMFQFYPWDYQYIINQSVESLNVNISCVEASGVNVGWIIMPISIKILNISRLHSLLFSSTFNFLNRDGDKNLLKAAKLPAKYEFYNPVRLCFTSSKELFFFGRVNFLQIKLLEIISMLREIIKVITGKGGYYTFSPYILSLIG